MNKIELDSKLMSLGIYVSDDILNNFYALIHKWLWNEYSETYSNDMLLVAKFDRFYSDFYCNRV